MTFETSLQVVEVAAFSDAYFQLVERLPALKSYFALGEHVIIAGDGVALELAADGATKLSRGQLRTVLKGFENSL